MAISRVSAQDAIAGNTTQNLTANYPSTPTQGNLLVGCAYSATGLFTLLSPTGWTLAGAAIDNNFTNVQVIAYKIAGAAESTSVTFSQTTGSNAVMRAHIFEYTSSNAPLIYVDPSASAGTGLASNSSITSILSNSVTTKYPNALLFCAVSYNTNVTTSGRTFDSSFSVLTNSQPRLVSGNRIVSSSGTYSTTCSWTTASTATCSTLVAFAEHQSMFSLMGSG